MKVSQPASTTKKKKIRALFVVTLQIATNHARDIWSTGLRFVAPVRQVCRKARLEQVLFFGLLWMLATSSSLELKLKLSSADDCSSAAFR